ncbi:MAG: sodium:proton antiporter [Lachnospiraceae bacterium]|nr:sodium:proton antiporter [Lachnospiraceae bacterium]
MMEITVLVIFVLALFLCIGLDLSIVYALLFGFWVFFAYGIYKKHTVREMFTLAFSGIKTVKNILITFVLIGILTALWRAGGTIPYIVFHSTKICAPQIMVLITFLLCCMISFLTGTAMGTAATMGVICVAMAQSMGVPLFFTGGAVLAGSYFGDRCSAMSTSALLVSSLTKTEIYRNLINMVKTAAVPFAAACILYTIVGSGIEVHGDNSGIQQIFEKYFVLHPAAVIPAVVILLLSVLRVNVRIAMSISVLCSVAVCVLIQKIAPAELVRMALYGYQPQPSELAEIMSGGGVLSMIKVVLIVCISSCYAGMFNGTGLLDGIKSKLEQISQKATPFGTILLTSIITGMISCNQTLTIMLTHQLCADVEKDPEKMAVNLENTAVVIAPLIPWSIAGAVVLAAVEAPMACILTAWYLYFIPLWNLGTAVWKKNRDRKDSSVKKIPYIPK